MRINRISKLHFIILLLVINILYRLPLYSHELGVDTFTIHILTNSINKFGYAKWWIHLYSIGGFYPYSDSSALPFLLSGVSQCLNIDVEQSILIYCFIIGLFAAISSYILAGLILNNDFFKIVTCFLYSTTSAVLTYSTWTAPTRSLLTLFIPLFIFTLLSIKTYKIRGIFLIAVLFIFLAHTSHMFYFFIPIIGAYLFVTILYKFHTIKIVGYLKKNSSIMLLIFISTLFSYSFLTGLFFEQDGEFNGSKYSFLLTLLENFFRYTGPALVLTFGGLTYLILNDKNNFKEHFLLFSVTFLIPFYFIPNYMKWFIPIFFILISSYALSNISKIPHLHICVKRCIILMLVVSAVFGSYFQFITPSESRLSEEDYVCSSWFKVYGNNNNVFSYHKYASISQANTLTGSPSIDYSYGFVSEDRIKIIQKYSPTSPYFYFGNPYTLDGPDTSWDFEAIMTSRITDHNSYASRLINSHNISYYIGSKSGQIFTNSLQFSENCIFIYDSGNLNICNFIS